MHCDRGCPVRRLDRAERALHPQATDAGSRLSDSMKAEASTSVGMSVRRLNHDATSHTAAAAITTIPTTKRLTKSLPPPLTSVGGFQPGELVLLPQGTPPFT